MTVITSLLVANRGEIALRVMRTARAMGIRTVAVFTDLDASAPHVHAADDAIRVASYLDVEQVVRGRAAGRGRRGAPRLRLPLRARRVRPRRRGGRAHVRRPLGRGDGPDGPQGRRPRDRRRGRRPGRAAGRGAGDGADGLGATAFPVLVKAAAGGGGKGMRVVRAEAELAEAMASARREARSAFGDDTLLVEKYVEHGRHIEVQVLADTHGNVVHLFERDCSTQRRHQKVLEEAPAPDHLRRRAPGGHRGGRRAGPARGLRQRRHRRVPARRRHRRGLLPRDEHPPAGGAPGHRGGASAVTRAAAWTWSSCSCRSPPASRSASPRTTSASTGTPSRRGSTPRTPSTASCPRPAPPRSCAGPRPPASTTPSRAARSSARRTTRCWARSSCTAPTARPPGAAWSPPSTTPRSSASPPTPASCGRWSPATSSATPPSTPRGSTPPSCPRPSPTTCRGSSWPG